LRRVSATCEGCPSFPPGPQRSREYRLSPLVAIPMRRGERWSRYTVPALFLTFYVSALLAVLEGTPATPPRYGNAAACLATVVGWAADAP